MGIHKEVWRRVVATLKFYWLYYFSTNHEPIVVKDATYPEVLGAIWQMAVRSKMKLLRSPERLYRVAMMAAFEWYDSITRDPEDALVMIAALTPSIDEVLEHLPQGFVLTPEDHAVVERARQALIYNRDALEYIGQTARANRHETMKLVYYLAQRLQGNGTVEERRQTQTFLLSFRGYGRNKPEVHNTVLKYEGMLGRVFLLCFLAMQAKHSFNLIRLAKQIIRKYGSYDIHGLFVCYWERVTACLCGGRNDGRRPAELAFNPDHELPDTLAKTVDIPQMDDYMWTVYGLCRNVAIMGDNAWGRVMSEIFGEYNAMTLFIDAGGVDAFQAELGPLASEVVRHIKMARKKIIGKGIPMEDGLYFEAADAVDWCPLAFHAYGLSYTAGMALAMQDMAKASDIALQLPESMTARIAA